MGVGGNSWPTRQGLWTFFLCFLQPVRCIQMNNFAAFLIPPFILKCQKCLACAAARAQAAQAASYSVEEADYNDDGRN